MILRLGRRGPGFESLNGPFLFVFAVIPQEFSNQDFVQADQSAIRDSIVVSISACHADDPGSIPGRGVLLRLRVDNDCSLLVDYNDSCTSRSEAYVA